MIANVRHITVIDIISDSKHFFSDGFGSQTTAAEVAAKFPGRVTGKTVLITG